MDDSWVPEELDITPKVKSVFVPTEHLVANLIDQDSCQRDRGKLVELFIPKSVNRILGIHLSHQTSQDQIFWCLSQSREFTVKSAYNILRLVAQVPHQHRSSKDWKDIWKLKANVRLKYLLWKIA